MADTQVDMADALTQAVEKILKAAGTTVPSKVLATFVWECGSAFEELVPRIEIEWAPPPQPHPCYTCGKFEYDGGCPNHNPVGA